jgi:hypothetical protein
VVKAKIGTVAEIVVEPVRLGSWRLCDSTVPSESPGRILAFVDERAGCIEVMQLAEHFVWTTFSTMRSAIRHVAITHEDMRRAQNDGELAWVIR